MHWCHRPRRNSQQPMSLSQFSVKVLFFAEAAGAPCQFSVRVARLKGVLEINDKSSIMSMQVHNCLLYYLMLMFTIVYLQLVCFFHVYVATCFKPLVRLLVQSTSLLGFVACRDGTTDWCLSIRIALMAHHKTQPIRTATNQNSKMSLLQLQLSLTNDLRWRINCPRLGL